VSGLTDKGFIAKTIEELKAEIEDEQLTSISPALNLSSNQPIGQINAIFSKKLAELWELVATVTNSFNPRQAENFLLDNIAAISGTTRKPKAKSEVSVNCNVNNNFSAASGTMFLSVASSPGIVFTNQSDVGPLTPAGTYPILFESVEYGPVVANAGTLTVITPLTGWNSATNPLDAELGNFDELDSELQTRREDELTAPGACTVDSIRADVLKVPGVEQCYVFENVSLVTDENGLPGKAIEVVIHDGLIPAAANADIAQVVWDGKPSGSATYGTITQNVTDSVGGTRAVKFSRATIKNVYLEYEVLVDPNFFPAAGAQLIKDAAALYGDTYLNLGVDVFALAFKAQALTVPGVLDVTALRLGFAVSPTGTANLTITGREIADIDTSRITVAVTNGSP
jgi:hypothetical protein